MFTLLTFLHILQHRDAYEAKKAAAIAAALAAESKVTTQYIQCYEYFFVKHVIAACNLLTRVHRGRHLMVWPVTLTVASVSTDGGF